MLVAVSKGCSVRYPNSPPFHPSEPFPEYPFEQLGPENPVYGQFRELLLLMGLDAGNFGKTNWNPFGKIIRPNDTVLIKPNLVRHFISPADNDCLITNGSLIRAVLDYVYLATKGSAKVIIGDAPIQSGDFSRIIQNTGLDSIVQFYGQRGIPDIHVVDFREVVTRKDSLGRLAQTTGKSESHSNATVIDLKDDSELFGLRNGCSRFRVTNYSKERMLKHHNAGKNEYCIANPLLRADVVIHLPKLKTHRKAGFTCALKNTVGINTRKEYLAHHRLGSVAEGGDEYLSKSWRKRAITRLTETMDTTSNAAVFLVARLFARLLRLTAAFCPFKDDYAEGSWFGNDTLPRTITDINAICLYADKSGRLCDTIQRKMLYFVDAIVAGEKEGPLHPSPKQAGLLIGGANPVAVDLVCSRLMGFNYKKIPLFKYVMGEKKYTLFSGRPDDIEVAAKEPARFDTLHKDLGVSFIPSRGWKDHIEFQGE